jgi:3D (Asp-Asp-Asp) domain-containing protein
MLSGSAGPKVLVLIAAIAGIVLWYEARTLDLPRSVWLAVTGERGAPRPGARLAFVATAYCKGTTTASGVDPRSGVAAADPKLLPVGSVLSVAVDDPQYDGVYTVLDTGPKVQGRMLDLYMWSCHEALAFGRKNVQVTVLRLGWDPRSSAQDFR